MTYEAKDDIPRMTLQSGDVIYPGEYAITRDGQKVGPMVLHTSVGTKYYWTHENSSDLWWSDGTETDFKEKDLVAKWHDVAPDPEPLAPDYNNGEWHDWNGGECPVHPLSVVEVQLRNGFKPRSRLAGGWNWRHDNANDDISSFHVVVPYVEPAPEPAKRRKWWIVNSTAFESARQAKIAFPGSTPIKVKECKK